MFKLYYTLVLVYLSSYMLLGFSFGLTLETMFTEIILIDIIKDLCLLMILPFLIHSLKSFMEAYYDANGE